MVPVFQPEGSALCGQACVATVADVALDRVVAFMHKRAGAGTRTREIVKALRHFGIPCANRLRRTSKTKPVLPRRSIICIALFVGSAATSYHCRRGHWMVSWDGLMHDPGGRWPDGYTGWKITSYLDLTGGAS